MVYILALSLIILAYIYVGYPFLLWIFSCFTRKDLIMEKIQPFVSILIAAYNEERCIGDTILNKLELDYPADKLEIIVVSDASTDRTDSIVEQFAGRGVKLIRQAERGGKTSALNVVVRVARGDILLFSDANSLYAKDAVSNLMRNFRDPEVGYVTGKMVYVNDDGSLIGDGCSKYMKYENAIRALETQVGSVVGVDGGIDAMRKELYRPMRQDQLPDFILPLSVVEQGYRAVYEPNAMLKEHALGSSIDEYRMRVRVSLRALWALKDMRHLLNMKEYGIFSWQLLSHKCLRYYAFLFLALAYASNAYLCADNMLFTAMFAMQTAFYASALLCWILDSMKYRVKALYIPYYFSLVNLASAHASLKYFLGIKQVIWTPRKG